MAQENGKWRVVLLGSNEIHEAWVLKEKQLIAACVPSRIGMGISHGVDVKRG